MKKHADVAVLVVLAVVGFVFFQALSDFAFDWRLDLAYIAFSSLMMLPIVFRRFKWVKLGVYGVFLVLSVVIAVVPTTSRDFFLRQLRSIEPGMTVAQVDSVMRQYSHRRCASEIPDDEKVRPEGFAEADKVISFRHSDIGMYNADFGQVYLQNGRVLGTRFLPD